MNTVNAKINIILNRQENHSNIQDLDLEISFTVTENTGDVSANDSVIRLVNFGMMPFLVQLNSELFVVVLLNIKIIVI